ncbi:MAG: ankyrin repeat domain-containing protein [Gemmatimonadaceae bacterium]
MPEFTHLPVSATLEGYEEQANRLLAGHQAGDPEAIGILHRTHPRFLDDKVTWLPRTLSDDEIRVTSLGIDDARLSLARAYSFRDWDALRQLVTEVGKARSRVHAFEYAVEAVIGGEVDALAQMIRDDPYLLHARSTRVTSHDPPVHGATLLHYLAANGVEGYRQVAPPNGPEVARVLLEAGAEVDALAGMYGGGSTTLSMLVSSTPPSLAGTQIPLLHVLLDHGAEIEGQGDTRWRNPLMTALVFGFRDAAEALVARAARIRDLAAAAGLGRLEECRTLLPTADAETRHRALALAVQLGHIDVVRLLLDAGEPVDRFNPDGLHAHGTLLHHAAGSGHLAIVQLLVERGARTDIRDALWKGTPLGWARHGEHRDVAAYLTERTPP